jgi:hypothetical protein
MIAMRLRTLPLPLLLLSVGPQIAAAQEAPALDTPPPADVATDGEALPPLFEVDADGALIVGRRIPGRERPLPDKVTQENIGAVRAPPPEAFPTDQVPIPDRWRLIQTLGIVKERWWDPYNQNTYKGDRPIDLHKKPKWLPIKSEDWFLAASFISDTVVEPRSFPQPVGRQVNETVGDVDVFGRASSVVASQTFIAAASLFKGSTAFKPPDVEYKIALAFNTSFVDVSERRLLFVQPTRRSHRFDHFLGVQELFFDKHLRNVSDRYDFDSVRIGIQPFQADFRGFLFNDQQLGIRYFGNRDNNRVQYNYGVFWRLEKDTNSGLNSLVKTPRKDWVAFANVYRQDFPVPAVTSQLTVVYNMNREAKNIHIDDNGFPVRPALLGNLRGRNYDVVYLGYNADGHAGRINLTTSLYAALGSDRNSFFTGKPAQIRAGFAAVEASYDRNWARFRVSGLYATGDKDPYDNRETGFDAIVENPIFAGADTSYWIRQSLPFAGGGRVIGINGRNGVLNSLRSSKDEGQSNFNNPGTILLGAGADFDITPQFRLSTNANHLWFANTATVRELRNEGSIPRAIGWDLSAAAIYRPSMIQNVVFRLSGAMLEPGAAFKDLYTTTSGNKRHYSVLFNTVLSY